MRMKTEMVSLAGLTTPVVKKAVAASSYQKSPALSSEISSAEYASAKVASRFRLSISTARVVAHLSGLGGTQ